MPLAEKPSGARLSELTFVSVRALWPGQLIFHLYFLLDVPVIQPRWVQLPFALLLGAAVVAACSVDDANMPENACTGLNCNGVAPPAGAMDVHGESTDAPDASADSTELPAKAACGVGSCLPDDSDACLDYSSPPPPLPGGNGALDAGVAPAPGADAGLSLDGGVDGGDPNVDGNFNQPERPDIAPSRFSCQVTATARGTIRRQCAAAGSQGLEAACTSSLDCQPGLGCVGTVRSGRCLPYCCAEGADTCDPGFYCAERPLRSELYGERLGPPVPVCNRADNCSLGEPSNCEGEGCVCDPDQACTLVRTDGTTACTPLPARPGQAGDECPCDRGYHCSQATAPGTCVKTCDLEQQDSDVCGSGVCQATPVLPTGWGICVGAAPNQMPQP